MKRILIMALLLTQMAEADLGINQTGDIIHLYNDELDYYINQTDGIQLTNVEDEYWSKNKYCYTLHRATDTTSCSEDWNYSWTNSTDNLTYAWVKGTATITQGKYSVKVGIKYEVTNTTPELNISVGIKNKGKPGNFSLTWMAHDIKVGNDYENDYGLVYRNGTVKQTILNKTGFYKSYNDLDFPLYHIYDGEEWFELRWDNDSNYNVTGYADGEPNAKINLTIPIGELETNQTYQTSMQWVDALCTWNCNYLTPNTQQDITQGEGYTHTGSITFAGTCSVFGSRMTAQHLDGTWKAMTGSTNISTTSSNPVYISFCRFGTCGPYTWNMWGDELGLYSTRDECRFNGKTKTRSGPQINVTASEYMICTDLSTDKTLVADENACYNIIADDVVFNCDGFEMYGDQDNYAIYVGDQDNIEITNCSFTNYTDTIILNHSTNVDIVNNSLYGNYLYTPSVKDNAVGILALNTDGLIINDLTQWNFTVDRGGSSGAGGSGSGIWLDNTTNTEISNYLSYNNTGDYHSGGGDPIINDDGYGFYAKYPTYNLEIDGMECYNHSSYCLYLYGLTAKTNLTQVNDIKVSGCERGITAYWHGINITNAEFINPMSTFFDALLVRYETSYGKNMVIHGNNQQNSGIYGDDQTGGTWENIYINNSDEALTFDCNSDETYFKNITIENSQQGLEYCFGNITADGLTMRNVSEQMKMVIADNSRIINSYFDNNTDNFYYSLITGNLYFINTTANYSNWSWGSGTNAFTYGWWARINATNGTHGILANLTDTDNTSQINFEGQHILTPWYEAYEKKLEETGFVSYNPHNISGNKSGYYSNWTIEDWETSGTVQLRLYPTTTATTTTTTTTTTQFPVEINPYTGCDGGTSINYTCLAVKSLNNDMYGVELCDQTKKCYYFDKNDTISSHKSWNPTLKIVPYRYNLTKSDYAMGLLSAGIFTSLVLTFGIVGIVGILAAYLISTVVKQT